MTDPSEASETDPKTPASDPDPDSKTSEPTPESEPKAPDQSTSSAATENDPEPDMESDHRSLAEALSEDLADALGPFPALKNALSSSTTGPITVDPSVLDDQEWAQVAGSFAALSINWFSRLALEIDLIRAELEQQSGSGDAEQ